MDIPTCLYTSRYDFVSDEIGTTRSRGRARAQDSSYYLTTELESLTHKREVNNKIRENEMEEAIDKWPEIDKNIFHNDVEKKTVNISDLITFIHLVDVHTLILLTKLRTIEKCHILSFG